MKDRFLLQSRLEEILGTRNVYFQPPENITMSYPAIVYNLEQVKTEFANNNPYSLYNRYQVTYIDRNPDSDIPRQIQSLPMSRFTSYFPKDGLNHYNHTIYH